MLLTGTASNRIEQLAAGSLRPVTPGQIFEMIMPRGRQTFCGSYSEALYAFVHVVLPVASRSMDNDDDIGLGCYK